jgi:hypothetical protein
VAALACGVVSIVAPLAAFFAPHDEYCGFEEPFFLGGPFPNWLMSVWAVAFVLGVALTIVIAVRGGLRDFWARHFALFSIGLLGASLLVTLFVVGSILNSQLLCRY